MTDLRVRAEIEKRRLLEDEGITTVYQQFAQKYLNNPADFVRDCFVFKGKEKPDEYQLNIMQDLVEHKRVCVRAPHGAGKSCLMSWVILWFALTRDALEDDWKIPTTASAWRQLTKFLWP